MSKIERPVEYIDDYWGGDPYDLKDHAKFILHGYIMQNERVGILAATFAYDLMIQAAEEIIKLHARIQELDAQIDLHMASDRCADALTAVLDKTIAKLEAKNAELKKERQGLLNRLEHVLNNALNCVKNCKKDTDA